VDSLIKELLEIEKELKSFVSSATKPSVLSALDGLEKSAQEIGRAWSGSWIGYHANVYYENLQSPPPGNYFSSMWGFRNAVSSKTRGEWIVCDPDQVKREIEKKANQPDIEPAAEFAQIGKELFDDKRDQIISIFEARKLRFNDSFLNDLLEQTKKLRITSEREIITNSRPPQVATRDSGALSQGFWTPPHIAILAKIASYRSPVDTNKNLADIAQKAASHIERVTKNSPKIPARGNKVFIGHGRSHLWKDLKDFIQDRLRLEWDEFNRVAVAGITTIDRLSEMLNSASIAFLVMTAEEEHADGNKRARMNVIHEAGLFQGRLGVTRAIVLLEEGCEEFSNIQGLSQIRFPPGNIKASFEDIRLVLEREGIIA
jgi:predicted nucleotide-binding protein